MWNQVNCAKNHYEKVGSNSPYKQRLYPKMSCPHHQCSMSIMFRIAFGPRQSTWLVMLQIDYIVIDFTTRPHMNCLLEESKIFHIFERLVANVIFSRRELDYQSFKANVMKVFFLGSKVYRVL